MPEVGLPLSTLVTLPGARVPVPAATRRTRQVGMLAAVTALLAAALVTLQGNISGALTSVGSRL